MLFKAPNGTNGTVLEYSAKSRKISIIRDLLSAVASFRQSSYIKAREAVSSGSLKSTPATAFLALITPRVSIMTTLLLRLLNCFTRFLTRILFSSLSSILISIFLLKDEASITISNSLFCISPTITGSGALIELLKISNVKSFISASLGGNVLS